MTSNEILKTDEDEIQKSEDQFEELMIKYKTAINTFNRRHWPCSLSQQALADLLKEAIHLNAHDKKTMGKEAAERLENVITLISREKVKPTYADWCLIFKLQINAGDFYPVVGNHAGAKGSKLVTIWNNKHPRDLNFLMAAIFSGYEEILIPEYEQIYFSICKARGTRNAYFRENSIRFFEEPLPYHVVYAAICKALPESIYTRIGQRGKGCINPGMQGFPKVWLRYTWNLFSQQYRNIFAKFRHNNDRELEAADILVSALTQPNRYHGLKLMDPEECPVLKSWIEALPEAQRDAIEAYQRNQRVKIDNPEKSKELEDL